MERTESRADVVKYRIVSPMKTRSMPRDVVESGEEDIIPPTQLITSNTPHFNPHKCLKTPQSEECSKRERPSQFERQKRKGYSPCKASPQKVPKKYNSGCFAELANAFTEADNEIMKLKNKIDAYENKIQSLECQNTELSKRNWALLKMEGRLLTDLQSKEKQIEELTKNVRIREEIESTLVKDLHLMENRYNHMHNNCANLENKLKAAQTDNLNLEKFLNDVQQYDEKKVFELNRKIRVLKLEMERISLEKSLTAQIENYHKSREEKYKMEIEKLIGNYDVRLTEMRKIETQISTLIESRDERKTEIEKLKKDLDTKLTTVNEQNGITQEKESFEKLQKYLQERKEKHKVEDARIEQAMQGIEDLGKYLKERDEILFKKKKEVLEKQREDTEKTTDNRKYNDRQKDEGFKSVEKCQEGKKTDQSRQEKEGLDKLSKNVNEKEENEHVAKTRKDAKVVKVRSVSEIEFDNLLNNIKEKDQNKLIKDSSAKTKGAVTEKAKPVTTETIKETGNQMEIDEDASKNLFPDVSKEVSSQQIMRDDEYDFIFQVERTYLQSEQKARISNKNTFSQFDARIEKIKGTNEDKNDLSPKKIFTTGIRHYSRPKLQLRKW